MIKANWRALFGLVIGQVAQCQASWIAGVLLHLAHQGLGHLAAVKRLHALVGDTLQHSG
jgi:hypothetical protein